MQAILPNTSSFDWKITFERIISSYVCNAKCCIFCRHLLGLLKELGLSSPAAAPTPQPHHHDHRYSTERQNVCSLLSLLVSQFNSGVQTGRPHHSRPPPLTRTLTCTQLPHLVSSSPSHQRSLENQWTSRRNLLTHNFVPCRFLISVGGRGLKGAHA